MILRSVKKRYKEGTHRARLPNETLEWLEEIYSKADITRVADITGLDRIGIPVFTAMRPLAAEGAITVYTGKGHTPQEAKISAIMEAIERFSGEPRDIGMVKGSYEALCKSYRVLDPFTLNLPKLRRYSHNENLEWVQGHSLISGEEIFVPAEAVFHPYRRENQLFRTNTNGLATGNVIEEAILHGLLEVIERDAWSLFELGVIKGKDLQVDHCNLAGELLRKFRDASVQVYIKNITSDIGIPTIAVAIDDEVTKDPALLSLGVGSHLVPEVALVRALTEAAQSRLTTIHGTREDTYKAVFARRIGYERMKRLNRRWFEESDEKTKMSELEGFDSDDVLEDIRYIINKLREAGLNELIVVDLTRREVSVPAVRVIVPGLEVYALDKERIGRRALEKLKMKA
ncbi:MAG: YcaO-related McrA-glycine thioamidation protein [Candidatus Methanomethylicota archaeon]|uniref:YcaO-related McrA-glycine thioamidation protein n=1 Tax=Thermoproteota archaeon TaxID=2056631 RepID=A0A523B9K5_9CREN|nr:MAG: YcaO-related McrA-glycine thioamidation protein [Candidatus Verstraetearchaeota archaeon]